MARARILKPSFFLNEQLGTVEPIGRLLFAGLWCIADREGRLEERPARIRAEVLPYDPMPVHEVDAYLAQLAELGFIVRYECDGHRYIQVSAFTKHQNPHVREAASTIPAPEDGVPVTAKAMPKHDLGDVEPGGIRYTVPNSDPDPVTEAPLTLGACADAPKKPRALRKRSTGTIPEDVLAAIQAEEPDLDIPAFAADYLNWTGSDGHKDKVQGFRNQLRVPWRRAAFTRRNGNGQRPKPADDGDDDIYLRAIRDAARERARCDAGPDSGAGSSQPGLGAVAR